MKRWGVALGGGGVAGVSAALGFLEALQGFGLTPDVVVGSSSGGLVAGALGAGVSVAEQMVRWRGVVHDPYVLLPRLALHLVEALRPSPTPGLITIAEPVAVVLHAMPGRVDRVSGWTPGYGAMLTDLTAGETILLHEGSPAAAAWPTPDALVGTAAYPGLIAGVRHRGHLYCDGGLFDLVPVAACRQLGAEVVIGVRVGAPVGPGDSLSIAQLMHAVTEQAIDRLSAATNPQPADLGITLATSGTVLTFSHWQADEQVGATAAATALDPIRLAIA